MTKQEKQKLINKIMENIAYYEEKAKRKNESSKVSRMNGFVKCAESDKEQSVYNAGIVSGLHEAIGIINGEE